MTAETVMPCLWFDGTAEEAVAQYCAVVPGSRIHHVQRRPEGVPGGPAGNAFVIDFTLGGAPCMALNGGPGMPPFSGAISLVVPCATQQDLDRVWDGLLDGGGKAQQCGWLTDRHGVTWQVVPATLARMLRDGAAAQRARLMAALMPMVKLDIATLEAAWAGGGGAGA